MSTFAERLAATRALAAAIHAGVVPDLPGHIVDQVAAATEDAHGRARVVAAVIPLIDPGRGWRESVVDCPPEVDARIIAALLDDLRVCPHLKHPQPAWARLALHRVDCARCTRTFRHPPTDEDDRCDWCGARGISWFHPVLLQRGPVLIGGDACPDCAEALVGLAAQDAS